MQIKPIYNIIDNWVRNLSSLQYALLAWGAAFSVGVPTGLMFPGNTFLNAALTAAGSATGVALVFYFAERPDG
ncbi:hypothetical protein [Halocatena salina]|uniref:Uncharacterized protein n=1 Tax=Halocatena salina TaxID=2934340 RepID=A0A8U0A6X5_9EURY|nr:hypothetical protein [Halocatena salina]UPM44862.1 hypothetical protein MW046_15865 [Halocatena salina]